MSVCLSIRPSDCVSIRPRETTQLPLDGFSWNLYTRSFRKPVYKTRVSLKSHNNNMYFTGRALCTYEFLLSSSENEKCYRQSNWKTHNLRINNQQDASSIQNFILSRTSTCFGHLLCPSSGVISCTRDNWYVSCRLCGRCLGQSGSNLTLLGSGHVTCMKHTNCHVYSW
jgi:hypothetical protein